MTAGLGSDRILIQNAHVTGLLSGARDAKLEHRTVETDEKQLNCVKELGNGAGTSSDSTMSLPMKVPNRWRTAGVWNVLNERDIFWTDIRGIRACWEGTMRKECNGFGVQLFDHDGERWLRLVSSTLQAETKVCETLMKV